MLERLRLLADWSNPRTVDVLYGISIGVGIVAVPLAIIANLQ